MCPKDTGGVANSVDPDQTAVYEQSNQGQHCLPFCLDGLDAWFYGYTTVSEF